MVRASGDGKFESMLPLVCNEAAAILFVYDLSRKESLDAMREWYRKVRKFNKNAIPFLVGSKYDIFYDLPVAEQMHITAMSRRFAAAIAAPLIFCAPSVPINVTNVFKVTATSAREHWAEHVGESSHKLTHDA